MAYVKTTVLTGDIITATWGNAIQTQYEEAVADAITGAPVTILDRVTSTTEIGNTALETTAYSATIAGGVLGATGGLRLQLGGEKLVNTPGGGFTVRVKFGATTVASVYAPSTVSAAWRGWWIQVLLQNTDVSNQRVTTAIFASIAPTTEQPYGFTAYSVATENTASAKNLVVTVQPGSALAQVWRVHHGVLEKFKAV